MAREVRISSLPRSHDGPEKEEKDGKEEGGKEEGGFFRSPSSILFSFPLSVSGRLDVKSQPPRRLHYH